jgi:hypothetical protein
VQYMMKGTFAAMMQLQWAHREQSIFPRFTIQIRP